MPIAAIADYAIRPFFLTTLLPKLYANENYHSVNQRAYRSNGWLSACAAHTNASSRTAPNCRRANWCASSQGSP
jgi:hypothetical protein